MKMPHMTAQSLLPEALGIGREHTAREGSQGSNRQRRRLTSSTTKLDFHGLSAKGVIATPQASSSSSRDSRIEKLSVLPTATPTSTTSTIFDSPQKSSPSSSVSSTYALAIVQRANTPIAELEDTSPAYIFSELEDTSNLAIRSRARRNATSYITKSNHPTALSLVRAVDRQFTDYEAEIRFLRNNLAASEKSLREVRKSLCEAKVAANESNHALDAAQEAIADRDYEIKIKKNVIEELERDVKHCHRHHPPPIPPSKWRGPDGPVSRFNADANRSPRSSDSKNSATALSPSLIGRQFATSPKSSSEGSSKLSAPKTPRSTFFSPSHGEPSPSTGGSPFLQSQKHSPCLKASTNTLLTSEALAIALSAAVDLAKSPRELPKGQRPEVSHTRKSSLGQLNEAPSKTDSALTSQKALHHSRCTVQASASTPNLCVSQGVLPWSEAPALPPRLPRMSGGLGIVEKPFNETQEQRLRKKHGAFGDLFRRKEQGTLTGDDVVRRKVRDITGMHDMVYS